MNAPVLSGLGPTQVAKELGVTRSYVHQLIREGRLPYMRTSIGRLVDPDAVAAFKREREAKVKQSRKS